MKKRFVFIPEDQRNPERKSEQSGFKPKSDPDLTKDAVFLNAWKKNNDLEDLQIISPDPSESFLSAGTEPGQPLRNYTNLFSQGPLF